jgi:hypothetical protein
MRKTMWVAAALVLALAACGKSGNQDNGSASAAADVQLQPGEWEMVRETVDVRDPDTFFPPAEKKGEKTTKRYCLTPEQAAQPVKMLEAEDKGLCDYKDYSFANGRMGGTITCGTPAWPGKITISSDGQYDGQSYAHTDTVTNRHQSGATVVEYRVAGHRVGDCPPA